MNVVTRDTSHKERIVFLLIVLLFGLYSAFFVYRTSFVVNGERYFTLFDDAMISMRYAKNLVEGHGLVMNPGERVEGFTNPLWVAYMVLIHLLPVRASAASLFVQIAGALLTIVTVFMVMRIASEISGGVSRVSAGAMFLTAFYLPLISWCLQGMEVSLVMLVTTTAVWMALRLMRDNRFSVWLYVLLGAGTLVRIDMAVPFLGIAVFLLRAQPQYRKRHLLWGCAMFAVFMGAQTILRLVYYGDLLPNTYYLKMTGYPLVFRVSRGFIVFFNFIWRMNILFFLVPFIMLAVRPDRMRGLCAWLFGLQCLYSVYVGGDAWEFWGGSNRYISAVMPLFFVLFADALDGMVRFFRDTAKKVKDEPGRVRRFLTDHSFALVLVLGFFQFNNNHGPLNFGGFMLLNLPPNVEGNNQMVELSQIIRNISTPDARVAVTWAGALPYFSGRYTVDILGKTDRVIAHEEMKQGIGLDRLTYFYPGHLKFDYPYSIGKQNPDIIAQLWLESEAYEYTIRNRYTRVTVGNLFFYVRNDSRNILWDRLGRMRSD